MGRNAGWLGLAQVVSACLVFIQSILTTNLAGAQIYGQFVLVVQFGVLIYAVCDANIWEMVLTYVPHFQQRDEPAQAMRVFHLAVWLELATGLLIFALYWVLAPWFAAHFLNGADVVGLLRLYALSFLLRIPVELSTALLQLANHYAPLARTRIVYAVMLLGGVVVAALLHDLSLTALVIVELLGWLVFSALLLVQAVGVLPRLGLARFWTCDLRGLLPYRRQLVSFVASTSVIRTTMVVQNQTDLLLLGWLTNPAAVGVYALARRIVFELRTLVMVVSRVLYPELTRLVALGAYHELRQTIRRVLLLTMPVLLVAALAAAWSAAWLVPLVYGADFAGAVPVLSILLLTLVTLPVRALKPVLMASGHAYHTVVLEVGSALLLAVGAVLIIPHGGLSGLALVVLLMHMIREGLRSVLILRVVMPPRGQG